MKRRTPRHLCVSCKRRPAISRCGGRWIYRRDHELCQQCAESAYDMGRMLAAMDWMAA